MQTRPIKIPTSVLSILLLLSFVNYSFIVNGYIGNYQIHLNNEKKLVEAAAMIRNGKAVEKITLHKFDTRFSAGVPWGKTSYETIWMKSYYHLPRDVVIEFDGIDKGEKTFRQPIN